MEKIESQPKPLTKEMILQEISKLKPQLHQMGLISIGLFGSYSRGEGVASSDIDLLVDFEPGKKTFNNYMLFVDLLEEKFSRKVDVVTKTSLSPHLAPYILNEVKYVSL